MKITRDTVRDQLIESLSVHSAIDLTVTDLDQKVDDHDIDSLDVMEVNLDIEVNLEKKISMDKILTTVFILDDIYLDPGETFNNWIDKIAVCIKVD